MWWTPDSQVSKWSLALKNRFHGTVESISSSVDPADVGNQTGGGLPGGSGRPHHHVGVMPVRPEEEVRGDVCTFGRTTAKILVDTSRPRGETKTRESRGWI
ncbi:predicted protein [Aspergillus terreus NIH2624]|uniref:Uncharacterized protein n=1 Tax=Aspergillus terreus (strain NIH 2624 / FGSC A1156) TaxID=341663 RepID=Q0CEN0_ASPTN|nr:uncharacterized protein ATEG_07854 [Aspergillus terreus NIH2624]EAU32116.1 predicted protein [Aspergillus terreus NIH2624]